MNFLSIARRLRQEAGIAGTGPTSVVSQAGEMGRVVDWVNDAWLTIQRKQHWDWLWEQATVTILAATSSTAGSIPANRYLRDKARIGTARLSFRPWERFSIIYPTQAAGTPSAWSIRPDGAFVVDAAPTASTAITVERYKLPTSMAADSDIPAMPERFHMAIVWRALMDASDYDEAGVSRTTAATKYAEVLGDALSEGRPVLSLGAPLL